LDVARRFERKALYRVLLKFILILACHQEVLVIHLQACVTVGKKLPQTSADSAVADSTMVLLTLTAYKSMGRPFTGL